MVFRQIDRDRMERCFMCVSVCAFVSGWAVAVAAAIAIYETKKQKAKLIKHNRIKWLLVNTGIKNITNDASVNVSCQTQTMRWSGGVVCWRGEYNTTEPGWSIGANGTIRAYICRRNVQNRHYIVAHNLLVRARVLLRRLRFGCWNDWNIQ